MLGRLTNLSQAVSGAVSSAWAGWDEIAKSYEMPKDSTASGGHQLLWKIYPALSKKTAGLEVSIFVFDKDELKKLAKHEQEKILEIMRHDMKTLRLLRHPCVKVEEVFDETKRILAFVTERVTCSLANVLKRFDRVGNITPEVLEIGTSEFENACGLMHIGEALSFLHREGRRVHLSLHPSSIFINAKGEWKLAGMGFSRVVEPGHTSRSEYYMNDPTQAKAPKPGKAGTAMLISPEPPLEYCSPELVTEPRVFNSSADMFSMGLLVYELFSPPRSDGGREPLLDVRDGNTLTYGYKTQSLHPMTFPNTIPVSLQNTIRSLLALQPSHRPEARMFLSSQFFDAGPIKTLRTLQTLVEQDPATQAKFLTALPPLLEEFQPRVLCDMVVPALSSVAINTQVAPFAIPPLLKIVGMVDKNSFHRLISHLMIPLLALTEPVQCMLMFATNLDVLIPKAEDGFIRDHIVPMLCRALDSNVPEILDTVLNKIVDQANLFEYRVLKQFILPRVTKLILQPPQLSVRINSLKWLAKSFHVFDKDLLTETVLPTLMECLQVDKSPAVCMCILGCYETLGKHLGPEFIARSIIPAIAPLLWETSLNGTQFDLICQKIQDMLQEVIREREKIMMSDSSVKDMTSGLEEKSGISSAVKAAEKSKQEKSGASVADEIYQATQQPLRPPPALSSSSNSEPYSDNPKYNNKSDDPFILSGGSYRNTNRPQQDRSGYENRGDHKYHENDRDAYARDRYSDRSSSHNEYRRGGNDDDRRDGQNSKESYAAKRRAKKSGKSRSSRSKRETDAISNDLLDIPTAPVSSGSQSELLSMSSSQIPSNNGSGAMFAGMNVSQSSQLNRPVSGNNMGMGGFGNLALTNGGNSGMSHLNNYNMGSNPTGYNNCTTMVPQHQIGFNSQQQMGNFQIENGQQQNRSNPNDKFSAFDGL